MILHICPKVLWKESEKRGVYEGDTFHTQGFIHCSTSEQLIGVANFLFKSVDGLVLLVIDENKVSSEIKYEDSGNKVFYPHIYGPLNLAAVVDVIEFNPNSDGCFSLPVKF